MGENSEQNPDWHVHATRAAGHNAYTCIPGDKQLQIMQGIIPKI